VRASRRREASSAGKRTEKAEEYDETAKLVHSRHVLSRDDGHYKSAQEARPPQCLAPRFALDFCRSSSRKWSINDDSIFHCPRKRTGAVR
jgi:hypothetical protein